MGLRIRTNVQSLTAQRALGESRTMMEDSLHKLSTGQRINRSVDDAAGLAVSETMRARMRSLAQAKRNANDGVSFLQVAEGGLSELGNMVVRMRELTTQAASDTIGVVERTFLNREFQQLAQEIERVTNQTEFNGKKVLNPEDMPEDGIGIYVGATTHSNDKDVPKDADVIRIEFQQIEDLKNALDELRDLNIEGESGSELGGDTSLVFERLDSAMNRITDFRATIGALQSRINSSITTIDVGLENIAAAQSRIRDVDYASETARLTQSKILSAAGTAVLAQANALPEQVLQLLR